MSPQRTATIPPRIFQGWANSQRQSSEIAPRSVQGVCTTFQGHGPRIPQDCPQEFAKIIQGQCMTFQAMAQGLAQELDLTPGQTLPRFPQGFPKAIVQGCPQESPRSYKDFACIPQAVALGFHQEVVKAPEGLCTISGDSRRSVSTRLVQGLRRTLCDSPKDSQRQSPNIASRS